MKVAEGDAALSEDAPNTSRTISNPRTVSNPTKHPDTSIVIDSNWSIELSKNWEYEVHKNLHFLFRKDGYGVLQISSYIKNKLINENDLIKFSELTDQEKNDLKMKKYGSFTGFELTYTDQRNVFRKKWLIKNNKLLLFIIYSCEPAYKEYELEIVNDMVHSLQAL